MPGMTVRKPTVDIAYCASSFLMHRTIIDRSRCFSEDFPPAFFSRSGNPECVHNASELEQSLQRQVEDACSDGKAALALSGGIDSAILARYMPKGSKAYTFKCVVPGIDVTDESLQAAKYAKECGLDHEIVEVSWNDVEELAPSLMKKKGAPIHSIEVQIAKAAGIAKREGFERIIFGESADVNYGGQSNIFSQVWSFGRYVERYSYVMPYYALKDFRLELSPFISSRREDGTVDVFEHFRNWYFLESMGSYQNALSAVGIDFVAPYANTWLDVPLDYERIRNGENKYLVREVFNRAYPGWDIPTKIPMPRPTEEWFANWEGPKRPEFWQNCHRDMTGDQRWLLWALEQFLNIIENE